MQRLFSSRDKKANDDLFLFGHAVQLLSLRKRNAALQIAAAAVVGVGDESNERRIPVVRLRSGKLGHQFRPDRSVRKEANDMWCSEE